MSRKIRLWFLGILTSLMIYLMIFLAQKDTPKLTKIRMHSFEKSELFVFNMSKVKVQSVTTSKESVVMDTASAESTSVFISSTMKTTTRGPRYCNGCFQTYFRFIINNDVCNNSDADIDLLILVTTAPSAIANRMALRRSWLSPLNSNNSTTRYIFLLGESSFGDVFKYIQEENELYHDMVMANFTDSYDNLTYKTKMGFYWASTMCPSAKFVMKTDQDVLVNVGNINKLTRMFSNRLQSTIVGACWVNRPVRNPKSKYYISYEQFPDPEYPKFCSGTGYLTSMNVVRKIYEVSRDVPFFRLEDIYVAFCREKLGFNARSIRGFLHKFDICFFQRNTSFTSHSYPPRRMLANWHAKCTKHNRILRPTFAMKRPFLRMRLPRNL